MFADDREKDCPYRIDSTPVSDLSQYIMLNFVNYLFFLNQLLFQCSNLLRCLDTGELIQKPEENQYGKAFVFK